MLSVVRADLKYTLQTTTKSYLRRGLKDDSFKMSGETLEKDYILITIVR